MKRFTSKLLTGISVTLIASSILAGCSKQNAASKVKAPEGWHLVWNDEFNGKEIDLTKWDFQLGTGSQYGLEGWGNNELQYYRKENASVKDGNLILEARKEDFGGCAYTSARLRTVKDDGTELFTKTYGRIEARIKMPTGNGIWPAFWLLPATTDYGTWASSGEIDILEAKGRLPNRVYGTVHFGQAWPGNKYSGGMYKFPAGETIADFHVYSLEWEPGLLRWLVDGNLYYETQQWWSLGAGESEPYPYPAPYDKPFYILLNFALGGNYDGGVAPEASDLPAQMLVDYVRVYDKNEAYATNVTRPTPQRDETNFKSFTTSDGKNFIFDSGMQNAITDPNNTSMLSNENMDVHERAWYFLGLSDFGGSAISKTEKSDGIDGRRVQIKNVGNQNYSVQLIQHLPVAKGYSYKIQFDAKASAARKIAIKLGGDADNSWAVYSPEYYPELSTETKHFSYFFTMENDTDPTARLEFNLGLDSNDVWIGNVSVTQEEL
ncbi:MAG: family 16 glycosylhydrolase [Treponema sp.]|nr:family 16 glycosylhydrolase [Treponema sp.]